ncbi:uncharacterized protein LOC141686304 [Apium graveolens]|uniref:uncharacterized protein LOC141686304 n=1 Tax=Apium graveolens TaxID=4045 RepID=UPI003D78D2B2
MDRLRRTARKSVSGSHLLTVRFQVPDQDPDSSSYCSNVDSTPLVSPPCSPKDTPPPSSEEPLYISSDSEEYPSQDIVTPIHVSPMMMSVPESSTIREDSPAPMIESLVLDRVHVVPMLVPDPEWHVRIEMVEQVACRRLDEGPSSSDANVEARRVHNLLRWMLSVLREIYTSCIGGLVIVTNKYGSTTREDRCAKVFSRQDGICKLDGTSHYLKGLVLCLAYVVIAACFFVQKLPSSKCGSGESSSSLNFLNCFKLGSEKHTTEVVLTKVGALRVTSGIEDLSLLKTAQSGFEGFVRDKNTILPETSERMLATEVSASWRYPFESPTSIPVKPLYFTKMYLDVKKVLAETFFGPPNEGIYSPSVQATLYQMGKVVLAASSKRCCLSRTKQDCSCSATREHKCKNYEVIDEARAFVGAVPDATNFAWGMRL